MNWQEFNEQESYIMDSFGLAYEKTTIECPQCGEPIYLVRNVVLTSYPPQYGYTCKNCGWYGTSHNRWH